MWWEPRSDHEIRLAKDMDSLRGFFGEFGPKKEKEWEKEKGPILFGFGSIWVAEYRALMPFMLFNSAHEWLRKYRRPFELFRMRAEKSFPPPIPLPLPPTSLPLFGMLVGYPKPSSSSGALTTVTNQLANIAGIIDDFVRIREPIICNSTGSRGSAGILVSDSGHAAVLSVGHVFPQGINSLVDQEHVVALFLRKRSPLGTVSHCAVPNPGQAGWDVAVIRLDAPIHPSGVIVTQTQERFLSPEPVAIHGGLSGFVPQAAVMGALIEVDYGIARWLNCWFIGPSGVLKSGDSGSAVFTKKDSCFLGLYVGSSNFDDGARPLFHYVQDGQSLDQFVLRGWGISL
jgi:hypothetical protein